MWAHLNERSWNLMSFRAGLIKGTHTVAPRLNSSLFISLLSLLYVGAQRGKVGQQVKTGPVPGSHLFPGDPATALPVTCILFSSPKQSQWNE